MMENESKFESFPSHPQEIFSALCGRSTGLASSSAHPSRFCSGMWGSSASRLLGQLEITRFPIKSYDTS